MIMSQAPSLEAALSALRARVDRHVTRDRVRRYLSALVDTPAPSTAAGAMRVPVLNRLLAADGAFDSGRLRLDPDFGGVGSPVIFTGGAGTGKAILGFRPSGYDQLPCAAGAGRSNPASPVLRPSHA